MIEGNGSFSLMGLEASERQKTLADHAHAINANAETLELVRAQMQKQVDQIDAILDGLKQTSDRLDAIERQLRALGVEH